LNIYARYHGYNNVSPGRCVVMGFVSVPTIRPLLRCVGTLGYVTSLCIATSIQQWNIFVTMSVA
jgi:hypothetical protein